MRLAPLRLGNSLPTRGMYTLQAAYVPALSSIAFGRESLLLDLRSVQSVEELFIASANAWNLPNYFGHNWDAFEECVLDAPRDSIYCVDGLSTFEARFANDALILQRILTDSLADHALVLLLKRKITRAA